MGMFFDILFGHFSAFDGFIVCLGLAAFVLYGFTLHYTDKVYKHFNSVDRTENLNADSQKLLNATTRDEDTGLTKDALLDARARMNACHSFYTTIISVFPLLGMLGTVCSLIPMVNMLGSDTTSSFFVALTSTFWGIVCAVIHKLCDAYVAYRIEDNEKHMEYYLNPEVGVGEGQL